MPASQGLMISSLHADPRIGSRVDFLFVSSQKSQNLSRRTAQDGMPGPGSGSGYRDTGHNDMLVYEHLKQFSK